MKIQRSWFNFYFFSEYSMTWKLKLNKKK
jgi:hypothetical protein